jgi:hypothetical protein
MRKLSAEKRAAIISALVEGNSINATVPMCDVSKITVLRLLADFGTFCAQHHNVYVRGLHSKRVQLDEIWSFYGCKDKEVPQGAGGPWPLPCIPCKPLGCSVALAIACRFRSA